MGGGYSRPKQPIPGTDLSGTVEAVGPEVTRLAVGENVFGESHGAFQWTNGGAFAEYAAVPESSQVNKPKEPSFEAAASVPSSGIIGHDHYGKSAGRIPGSLPKVMGQMLLALVDKTMPKPSFKTPPKVDLMNVLKDLLEKGALTPTVGRTYVLAEVPRALRDL